MCILEVTNNKSLITRLQYVQRSAARVIIKRHKFEPISSELANLHWLPIKQRIDFKVLIMVFKALHSMAPTYITDLLTVQSSVRHLRSSTLSSVSLKVPRTCHIKFADRSFSCYGPKLWNALPSSIKNATSISIFRKRLKTHLFKQAFES